MDQWYDEGLVKKRKLLFTSPTRVYHSFQLLSFVTLAGPGLGALSCDLQSGQQSEHATAVSLDDGTEFHHK